MMLTESNALLSPLFQTLLGLTAFFSFHGYSYSENNQVFQIQYSTYKGVIEAIQIRSRFSLDAIQSSPRVLPPFLSVLSQCSLDAYEVR